MEVVENLIGKENWDQFIKDIKLTPSKAGAGGTFNGHDLKVFLLPQNLEKISAKIGEHGETITAYMAAIDKLHTMCVAKSVIPYNVWGILEEFRETFTAVYDLGLGLSATTKIHICWTHLPEWFLMEETGKETLYTADCSIFESCHGAMSRIEESRNLKVRRNRGSDRERRALESTVAHHNIGTDLISDPRDLEVEVSSVEQVMEEINTLALTGDSEVKKVS